jgi:GTP-binding protein
MGYRYLQQLKESSQFGSILPVEFNPFKSCQPKYYPAEEIFNEIKTFITRESIPDFIWLQCSNDHALYPGFKKLLNLIIDKLPGQKVASYVNGRLFQFEEVCSDLLKCNVVAINLNSADTTCNPKVCGCECLDDIQQMLDGIANFRKMFEGVFGIYVMFIKDMNDNIDNALSLKTYLTDLDPDTVSIGEYPNANKEKISEDFKNALNAMFSTVPFKVHFNF